MVDNSKMIDIFKDSAITSHFSPMVYLAIAANFIMILLIILTLVNANILMFWHIKKAIKSIKEDEQK